MWKFDSLSSFGFWIQKSKGNAFGQIQKKKIGNMEISLSQVEKCLICIQNLFLLPLLLFPKWQMVFPSSPAFQNLIKRCRNEAWTALWPSSLWGSHAEHNSIWHTGIFYQGFFHQKGVEWYRVTQNTDGTMHVVMHMPLLPAIYSDGTHPYNAIFPQWKGVWTINGSIMGMSSTYCILRNEVSHWFSVLICHTVFYLLITGEQLVYF